MAERVWLMAHGGTKLHLVADPVLLKSACHLWLSQYRTSIEMNERARRELPMPGKCRPCLTKEAMWKTAG